MSEHLTGSEYVLIAQVPRAGGRWQQVHINIEVAARFFRLDQGDEERIQLEKVDRYGPLLETFDRPLVYSQRNKNYKIEFDFAPVRDYPDDGVPILLVLELSWRRFRYLLLLPGETGYDEMHQLNADGEAVGRGLRRVIANLDEVELRWPGCPLRGSTA